MVQFKDDIHWKPQRDTVISVGAFDGIHRGHRFIIERLVKEARQEGLESLLFTFHPHPKQILFPDKNIKLLTVKQEKEKILKQFSLNTVLFYPFSKDFARLTGFEFLKLLKEKYHVKKLLLGYNHRFGSDGLKDDKQIKKMGDELGFTVERLPQIIRKNFPVSSTLIKQKIENREIELANDLLGYDYLFMGRVIHGNKLGRKLGFPTANLRPLETYKLIPAPGVYLVKINYEDTKYYGVMNIGNRPTVDGKKSLEVHIFNFNKDIYDKTLNIHFLKFLRPEKSFSDLNELALQIQKDIHSAQSIISGFNS